MPVKAFVTSLVRERMEQEPKEKIDGIRNDVERQEVVADSYSREYTAKEKERLQNLRGQYEQGLFPEKELRQEEAENSSIEDELYFAQDTSTFYLPKREMTDEEFLEILDFYAQRDYALMQSEREVSKQENLKEKEVQERIEASGGITEEKVLELAGKWVESLYGSSGANMEWECFLNEEDILYGEPVYYAGGREKNLHNYSFTFSAKDGTLLDTITVVPGDEGDTVSVEKAEQKLNMLYEKARTILNGSLGKKEEFEQVSCFYRAADGFVTKPAHISFIFLKQDGNAYEITMNAVTEEFVCYYQINDYKEYAAGQEEAEKSAGSVLGTPEGKVIQKEMLKN